MRDSEFATSYIRRLGDVWAGAEATDRCGDSLGFSNGIERFAGLVKQFAKKPNKLIFVGNGGSAAIASHQAIDYARTGNFPALAFNDGALLTCLSNDLGYRQVFAKPLELLATANDVLIAISSSGQSDNILAAVEQGARSQCHVITMSAFTPDNPLRKLGDINFYLPTTAYGFAEIGHLAICHCVLDGLMAKQL